MRFQALSLFEVGIEISKMQVPETLTGVNYIFNFNMPVIFFP